MSSPALRASLTSRVHRNQSVRRSLRFHGPAAPGSAGVPFYASSVQLSPGPGLRAFDGAGQGRQISQSYGEIPVGGVTITSNIDTDGTARLLDEDLLPSGTSMYGTSPVALSPKVLDMGSPSVSLQSPLQTGFNIVNLFVGLGLLSTPFALAKCGWSGLLGLALAATACNYAGKTIVRAFVVASERSGDDVSSCSYPTVGRAAFGPAGEWAVVIFVVLEFFGAMAMCVVFMWRNIADLAPEWSHFWLSVLSLVAVLPTVWIKRFSELSFISLLGLVASVLITIVVITEFGVQTVSHGALPRGNPLPFFTSVQDYGVGIGIFTTSLAGQACLPVLYDQMRDKERYNVVLHRSFIVMISIYCVMSCFGVLLYGGDVHVLVTSSLNQSPGGIVSKVAMVLVIAGCACTIAPIDAVLADMIQDKLYSGAAHSHAATLIIRTAVVAIVGVISWYSFYYLDNLESIVGGIGSLFTSLLLPSAFYLKLCWSDMATGTRVLNWAMVLGALAMSAFVVVSNFANVSGKTAVT